MGPPDVSTAVIDPSGPVLESGDLDPGHDRDARFPTLAVKALDRVHVEREAALVLVQTRGDTLRAPVGEEGLHVRVDVGLPRISSERYPIRSCRSKVAVRSDS